MRRENTMEESLKQQFNQNGYVAILRLFSTEYVQLLKTEASRVIQQKFKDNNTGVYVGMAKASPVFKEAAGDPGIVAVLKKIIGDHIIFLSDKIVYKDAATDFGSPWHQDYPYWLGSHKYSAWLALDDASPENGCLKVIPGSHLAGAVNHGGDASDGFGFDNRLKPSDIDESQVVDLPASQGDVIIFHDLLLHSSYPNTTGRDRWALISTYKDGTQEDPDYPWAGGAFSVSK
jgi:phytanoyl-CoA hydroxylase